MPLLDSFMVDHTKMPAPAVREAKTMQSPSGDIITVFDLRFYKPNVDKMDGRGIHTLEHLFAGFIRDHLNSKDVEIIDVSPMGCRTGFYMSIIGEATEETIAEALRKALEKILKTSSVPEANIYQCGSCYLHSLEGAKEICKKVLEKKIKVIKNSELVLNLDKIDNTCPVLEKEIEVIGG